MRMSMTHDIGTESGVPRAGPELPSAASPTTSRSGVRAMTRRKPLTDERLVIGEQDPDRHVYPAGSRGSSAVTKRRVRPPAGVEAAAV